MRYIVLGNCGSMNVLLFLQQHNVDMRFDGLKLIAEIQTTKLWYMDNVAAATSETVNVVQEIWCGLIVGSNSMDATKRESVKNLEKRPLTASHAGTGCLLEN